MKDKAKKPAAPPPNRRKKIVEHLIAVAQHAILTSSDSEAQAEAVECKRILERRLEDIDHHLLQAA